MASRKPLSSLPERNLSSLGTPKFVVNDGTTGNYRVPADNMATKAELNSLAQNAATKSEVNTLSGKIDAESGKISAIEGKIPSSASSSNKLVDTDTLNTSMEQVAARYLSRDVDGNPFASYEQFVSAQTSGGFFYAGASTTPTKNDYVLVNSDSQHDDAVTRYWYTGSSWSFQYVVNNTPFTTEQNDAINSGITADKVSTYDGYATSKADKSYVDEMLGDVESLLAAL